MSWLIENPMTVVVLGGITALVFGGIWLQTGRKIELYVMLAILAFCVGVFVVSKVATSERQKVKATLYEVASAVQHNDVDAVVAHLHPRMAGVRQRAVAEMPLYKFAEVKIKNNLEIELFENESPPRAETTFNVTVLVSDRTGMVNSRRVPRFMRVTFLKEADHWRISDYSHDDPREGFKKRD